MEPTTLWHSVPGRLQSVAVANKSSVWGVTLDQQLCKHNPDTKQWQLVSITTESVNRSRFSSSSAGSALSTSSLATKKFASILPSLGLSSLNSNTAATTPNLDIGADDEDCESTMLVSAATDGTVVRLDGSFKAWYLIAPHDHADYEKDVIWIDLGHLWKCVSVASISQIWGLTEDGDIYYGTSDRFVKLEFSVTSGAGYDAPKFSQIAVGHDNLVLATDATSGRVFRLKTHPTASHPPIWSALPGAGPGTGLHMVSCTLSMADYIVGVARDGHAYRFRHHSWICLGGGAKIETLGVGTDGYVLSVDSDGDLFGCQLESTMPTIPRRVSSRGVKLNSKVKKEDEPKTPSSPQAPNGFDGPATPRQQSISKRAMPSPRELFEIAATDTVVRDASKDTPTSPSTSRQQSFSKRAMPSPRELFEMAATDTVIRDASKDTPTSPSISRQQSFSKRAMPSPRELFEMAATDKVVRDTSKDTPTSPSSTSPYLKSALSQGSRSSSFRERQKLDRSDSQLSSKRSYASDLASSFRLQRESSKSPSLSDYSPRLSASTSAPLTAADMTPLRIQTSYSTQGDSYFTAKPIATVGLTGDSSPETSFPVGGNPYSATSSRPSSSQPSSTATSNDMAQTPLDSSVPSAASSSSFTSTTVPLSLLRNSPQGPIRAVIREGQETSASGSRPLPSASDDNTLDSIDLLSAQRIHERSLATGVANFSKEEVADDPESIPVLGVESQLDLDSNVASYNHNVQGDPAFEPSKSEWTPSALPASNVNIAGVNSYRDVNIAEGNTAGGHGNIESRREGLAIWNSNRITSDEDKKGEFAVDQTSKGNNNDYYNYDSSVPSLSDPRTSYSTDHSLEPPLQPWVPHLQQQQQQHQLQQQYQNNSQSDQDLAQYQQASGLSSHRSSNSSDILMLQQQEFLRLTRLRSQPTALQDTISTKGFYTENSVPGNNDQAYSQQLQYLQQQPQGGPITEVPSPFNNNPEKMPLYSQSDEPGATGSRPSYSSAHLQGYLNATGVGVNGNNADGNSGLRNRTANVYNPDSPTTRRTGIQGEDEQGRWTGVPTVSDDRVYHYDPDVHKSKCCTIL